MLSIEREMCTNQRLTWCNDLVLKETYKFFNVDEERKWSWNNLLSLPVPESAKKPRYWITESSLRTFHRDIHGSYNACWKILGIRSSLKKKEMKESRFEIASYTIIHPTRIGAISSCFTGAQRLWLGFLWFLPGFYWTRQVFSFSQQRLPGLKMNGSSLFLYLALSSFDWPRQSRPSLSATIE